MLIIKTTTQNVIIHYIYSSVCLTEYLHGGCGGDCESLPSRDTQYISLWWAASGELAKVRRRSRISLWFLTVFDDIVGQEVPFSKVGRGVQ